MLAGRCRRVSLSIYGRSEQARLAEERRQAREEKAREQEKLRLARERSCVVKPVMTDEEIAKIWGGNILRVLAAAEKAAREPRSQP